MGREELKAIRARVKSEVYSLEACSRCGVVTDLNYLKKLGSDDFICVPCVRDQEETAEEMQWAGGND